jgi:hypothetical protein
MKQTYNCLYWHLDGYINKVMFGRRGAVWVLYDSLNDSLKWRFGKYLKDVK